jgi:ribosomal-protein-alanine N-acetyltransferase
MRSFDPFPELETPRLVLRRAVPADAEAFHRLRSDPEVIRYRGRPALARAEADRRLLEIDAGIRDNAHIMWAIALREDPRMIGECLLFHWEKEDMRAEVGYELMVPYWGRGLVTEAVRAMLTFGFQAMDLHRVEANVDPANLGSIRVLEKLGFVREGTLRENWRAGGRFVDSALFGLLRREFIL